MAKADFEFSVKVYYEDTDAGGVVYHANYLKFMERARSEFLSQKGFSVVTCEQQYGIIFVVRHIDVDFILPATLGETLNVRTKVIKLGKVGMKLQQDVYNHHDLLICSGLVKLASLSKGDSGELSLCQIPSDVLQSLSSDG